jgi:hypothetical protein
MDQEQLSGKTLSEWADLFSDSAFDQSLLEEEFLFERRYPTTLRLALWLDYFLMAGQDRLKEKWALLSLEEQHTLGIELLKCYLSQPLFLRLSQGKKLTTKKPWRISEKPGRLLQVEVKSGTSPEIRFFYPLAHHRLWPGILTVFKEEFFSSKEVFKHLYPELTIASSSRLETIRRRAETLGSFFLKGQGAGVITSVMAEEQANLEKSTSFTIEDVPAQTPGGFPSASAGEPTQAAPKGADLLAVPPTSPPKKKKRKLSTDQLKLF